MLLEVKDLLLRIGPPNDQEVRIDARACSPPPPENIGDSGAQAPTLNRHEPESSRTAWNPHLRNSFEAHLFSLSFRNYLLS
jgi:hypothetical protein